MIFCHFPCNDNSRRPQWSCSCSGDFFSLLSRDFFQTFVLDFSELLRRFLSIFLQSSLCFKMSFWKALNSIEQEDEESNDCVQEIRSESSIEPLITELCETKYIEEPSQLQELVAVVDQVLWLSNTSVPLSFGLKAALSVGLMLPLNGWGICYSIKLLSH